MENNLHGGAEERLHPYGRTELALKYAPGDTSGAAWRKLNRWIVGCPPLFQALMDLGYTGHQRLFTPEQVRLIFYYLGEP